MPSAEHTCHPTACGCDCARTYLITDGSIAQAGKQRKCACIFGRVKPIKRRRVPLWQPVKVSAPKGKWSWRTRTAHYEATKAVAAIALGLPIPDISIIPPPKTPRPCRKRPQPPARQRVRDIPMLPPADGTLYSDVQIIALLAPIEAQRQYNPFAARREAALHRDDADFPAMRLIGYEPRDAAADPALRRRFEVLKLRARQLVEDEAEAIDMIASDLEQVGRMTAERAREVYAIVH